MPGKTDDVTQKKKIRQKKLHGIEMRPNMFTIATTNMILRGDGKSNLINDDFFKQDANKLQLKQSTVGMMNPPYSQGSKQNPDLYEMAFVKHLLDVWFGRIEAETKFCVETAIEATDEWLHSFYYFNDEIPTEADFIKTVGDYLTFEFSMIMQDREYLFEEENNVTVE